LGVGNPMLEDLDAQIEKSKEGATPETQLDAPCLVYPFVQDDLVHAVQTFPNPFLTRLRHQLGRRVCSLISMLTSIYLCSM